MDDVARAAGLSRQGLYLHFQNKEALFKATVMRLLEEMRSGARQALTRDDASVTDRVLGAFVAMFADAAGSERHDELFATIVDLLGPVKIRAIEDEFASDVARVFRAGGVAAQWKEAGISTKELVELLFAASDGIRRRAKSAAEYQDRMRVAVQLVCRGARA